MVDLFFVRLGLLMPLRYLLLASILVCALDATAAERPSAGARSAADQDGFARMRQEMVERDLHGRGIHDRRVLGAMNSVPRHLFVPEALQSAAYEDRPLPIGEDQTISQPYIVAFMTELLELKGAERVLEIGTGSGYQTAVLAQTAAEVYSIEILPKLSARAATVLQRLGVKNTHLKVGDGFFGWPERAPFDAILVTAAAPDVPAPLWGQLRDGGHLIMPRGEANQRQTLIRVRKSGNKKIVEEIAGVIFVPLVGAVRQKTP
jgi:protein-L-isoaspartate(D-aspartate) O-methyltransferase